MSVPAPPAPGLLDVEATAAYLGVPVRFVRRVIAQRRIAFHKVGKYVRFHPEDLDRYLAEHRVEANSW